VNEIQLEPVFKSVYRAPLARQFQFHGARILGKSLKMKDDSADEEGLIQNLEGEPGSFRNQRRAVKNPILMEKG
jgi:hypothetical protein